MSRRFAIGCLFAATAVLYASAIVYAYDRGYEVSVEAHGDLIPERTADFSKCRAYDPNTETWSGAWTPPGKACRISDYLRLLHKGNVAPS